MLNDLRYTVRSREIVDLATAMKNASLTLSPYFQRNLVWRDAHKRDFIETILKGFPFPQIFLARGPIDVENMTSSQAVVDGQQRLNAIREFIDGKLEVEGRFFRDLEPRQKEEFLKYEVAVIDFDLEAGDPRLKDVFHRLNRTYYALSAIEKLASEYSASEFMLVARALAGEILKAEPLVEELGDIGSEEGAEIIPGNMFSRDPGIGEETWTWIIERAEGPLATLLKTKAIFTPFEFDRKVPLMFALNAMCTYLTGYYNRNDRVRKFLDDKSETFAEKEEVISVLNETAEFIKAMDLPLNSMWWNKANFFTLLMELSRVPMLRNQSPADASASVAALEENLPAEYSLAAREAVNNRAQREFRAELVRDALAPQ
ncbi:DUF262 domain-containing protein [Altererythrobacter sp. TH136]|uniref:DUF262 domain-containing protein n=1 Tax=Altererythrobacter sp. TH136 TaxID=2067415 RepID=UPI0011628440|nr:DUF262 domain-containing protein [Altererythrobacter sp. TH136]QDM40611.1 DUF262 domain-containing protein [Altererythrobacter sp. TH136]